MPAWEATHKAEIRAADGTYIACVGDPAAGPTAQDKAHARLIALAPEMLAELQETVAWLDERAAVVEKLGAGSHGRQGGERRTVAATLEAVKLRGRAQLIRLLIAKAVG